MIWKNFQIAEAAAYSYGGIPVSQPGSLERNGDTLSISCYPNTSEWYWATGLEGCNAHIRFVVKETHIRTITELGDGQCQMREQYKSLSVDVASDGEATVSGPNEGSGSGTGSCSEFE